MITDNLKSIVDKSKYYNSLYLRNLLKEQLQYYVLNFVYNSPYGEKFLFKGGTALKFCFDLPRLSEDLDFDVQNYNEFNHTQFVNDIGNYFKSTLKFDELSIKVSGVNKIIYLEFPILDKIGYPVDANKPTDSVLFVRIDTSSIGDNHFHKEISLKSTSDFSFIIQRYALPDMFAGKLVAVLSRETWERQKRQPRFKGRDYFDIFWLYSKGTKINSLYLKSILKENSSATILKKVEKKLLTATKRKQKLRDDLLPFFPEKEFVENFLKNFDIFIPQFLLFLKQEIL